MIFLNYLLIRPKCIGRQIDGCRVLVYNTHIKNRAVTSASRLGTLIRLYFISLPLFFHQQTPIINVSKLFKVTINLLTNRHFLSYKIYKEISSETHLHLKSFFVANYILF